MENHSKELNQVFIRNPIRGKYMKFSNENKLQMQKLFQKNYYPSKEEYEDLAQEIKKPVDKIMNWFKHERRKFSNKGQIKNYKKRRIFNKHEENILEKSFKDNTHPPAKIYTNLANKLKCKRRQVRKWFSYRRVKFENLKNKRKKKVQKNKLASSLKIKKKTGRAYNTVITKIKIEEEKKSEKLKPINFVNPVQPQPHSEPSSLKTLLQNTSPAPTQNNGYNTQPPQANIIPLQRTASPSSMDFCMQMMLGNFLYSSQMMMMFSEWIRFLGGVSLRPLNMQ